jgi:hypothetical protein
MPVRDAHVTTLLPAFGLVLLRPRKKKNTEEDQETENPIINICLDFGTHE